MVVVVDVDVGRGSCGLGRDCNAMQKNVKEKVGNKKKESRSVNECQNWNGA